MAKVWQAGLFVLQTISLSIINQSTGGVVLFKILSTSGVVLINVISTVTETHSGSCLEITFSV